MAIFRRVGIKAHWRFAVSVGGSWLCFGRLDQKKSRIFFWRVWAGFLSPTSHVIFGTAHSWPIQQPAFGLSGLVLNTKPKSGLFFCCIGPEHHRLEPRGTASALARGRSAVITAACVFCDITGRNRPVIGGWSTRPQALKPTKPSETQRNPAKPSQTQPNPAKTS